MQNHKPSVFVETPSNRVQSLYTVPEHLQQRGATKSSRIPYVLHSNPGWLRWRICSHAHSRAALRDRPCWPPPATAPILALGVPFPPKLQLINIHQHLQEIKTRAAASRCRSGRLGCRASHINIAAARGADVSGGSPGRNYSCGDYHCHLWDWRVTHLAQLCTASLHIGAIWVLLQGSGGFCDVQHRTVSCWETLLLLKLTPEFPFASQGADFSPRAHCSPEILSGVVRRLSYAYICICAHIYMYVLVWICMCVYICIRAWVYVCIIDVSVSVHTYT